MHGSSMKQEWIWEFKLIKHNMVNVFIGSKRIVTFMVGRISQEHSTIAGPIFQLMVNA
jgi:hypothetical protein